MNNFLNIIVLYHVLWNSADPVFILDKFDYKLDNTSDLIKKGIPFSMKFTLEENRYTELTDEFLKNIEDRIDKIQSSKKKYAIDSILNHYRIGYEQTDPFIKYEQLWIGFNSLITFNTKNLTWGDITKINDFTSGDGRLLNKKKTDDLIEIFSKSTASLADQSLLFWQYMRSKGYSSLIDFLIKIEIPKGKPMDGENPTYSKDLENNMILKIKNAYVLFNKIVLCLYGIRNQLFHSTNYANKLDIGSMRLASAILSLIFRTTLGVFIKENTELE